MWWFMIAICQFVVIFNGVRQERRAGLWSWSKFFFSIAFAALEWGVVAGPLFYISPHSRWFKPIVISAVIVAALNFVWFVIVCRRWRLPDGRTSLQAYRDEHSKRQP